MTTYGVPTSTQDRLLDELERGETWDSLSGAAPTRSTTTTAAGVEQTVETFADGSIRVTELQKPAGPKERASISGCKTISSSHYDATISCNVSTNVVVASAAYAVTYHQVQGGNSSIVSRSSSAAFSTQGYLGTITGKTMKTLKATQSGSSAAVVTGYFTWNSSQGAGSRDYWLQFSVKGSSTWATNN